MAAGPSKPSADDRLNILRGAVFREPSEVPFASTAPAARSRPDDSNAPRWQRATHAFPRTFEAFWSGPPYRFSGSLASEISQAISAVLYFSKEINEFLRLKRDFEIALLTQDVTKVGDRLNYAVARLGLSTWTLEASVLLAERVGGLEAIRGVGASIYAVTKSRAILNAVHWACRRAEPAATAAGYDAALALITGPARAQRDLKLPAEHTAIRFNLYRARDFSRLDYFLWRESQMPVVDYYSALIRVLQIIGASGPDHPGWPLLRSAVARLIPSIEDPRLRVLQAISVPTGVQLESRDLDLLTLLDLYTEGRYGECRVRVAEALREAPHQFDLYELHARCCIAESIPLQMVFPEKTPAHDLHRRLFDLIQKADLTVEAVPWLHKFAYVYDITSVGLPLLAFVNNQFGHQEPFPSTRFISATASFVTPRLADSFNNRDDAIEMLRRFATVAPRSTTAALYLASVTDVPIHDLPIPPERVYKFSARRLEARGHFRDAADQYRMLHSAAAARATYDEDAATGVFRCLLAAGAFQECVRHTVDTYLRRKSLLLSVRLGPLLDAVAKMPRDEMDVDIDLPILYYIYYHENQLVKDSYRIYVASDDFLSANGVDRPSKLTTADDKVDPKHVFYLRYICTPDVLDNSPTAFKSSADVDIERISICQTLLRLDPTNVEETQFEIYKLTANLMIRRAVRDVAERKVHVDVAGIKETIAPKLRETFDRFVANAKLADERLRKIWSPSSASIVLGQDKKSGAFAVHDEAYQAFVELFTVITTNFLLSSEHGLNFYLSVRIRHGTLAGQLRRQFQTAHLVTTSDGSGAYETNAFWQEQFADLPASSFDRLDAILKGFSETIDSIIERVRSEWIQIRSDTHPYGLFNFSFGPDDLLRIHHLALAHKVFEFDDFFEYIIILLWSRTDTQLQVVRDQISHHLKDELIGQLDKLERDVNEVNESVRAPLFSNAITSCRTGIQNELDAIAGWFNITQESDAPDFEFSLVVDTALEIIKGQNPTKLIDVAIDVQPGIRLIGKTFFVFVDVLFILLGNVVSHAGPSPRAEVHVQLDEHNDLIIKVSNALPPGTDIEHTLARIEEVKNKARTLNAYTDAVSREGRSGYLKLCNLLRVGLQRSLSKITFEVVDNSKFVATVQLDTRGIAI